MTLYPKDIALQYVQSGLKKSKMSTIRFILIAILGGAFIAFGGLLATMVVGGSPSLLASNPGLAKFIGGALFPIGLMMVTITGADLFTSDCAGMTLSTLQRETKRSDLLRIWVLSFIFNFIGAQIVAYFLSSELGFFDSEPYQQYLHAVAQSKVSMSQYEILLRGIGANWLVCLGAWMGFAGKDMISKCLGIWIPVMIFVTLGYEHSIANMFYIPAAIYSGADITWLQFITDNLLMATLGNIIGGAVFVGCIYWYIYLKEE